MLASVFSVSTAQAQDVPSVAPSTDTVLPRMGIDPTLSDLREHLLNSYGDTQAAPKGVSAPNLQFQAELGISEQYITNAGSAVGGGSVRGSDFVTQVQPGLTINDTSQRLQINLDYRPTARVYAENFDFSQVQQQGSGAVTVTALPGWLYLDARGSISQQSIFGGTSPTTTLSPNERETVSSFSVSPYIARTFGGTGTAQAGVSYSYSATDSPSVNGNLSNNPFLNSLLQNQGAYGSTSLGTERAFTNFTTGENFGRFQDKAGIDASYFTGTGAVGGGRRVLVTDDVSYALTRFATLLGEAGYENLNYPRSQYAYNGPIGSGGVKLTPNKNSSLTLEYRYVDGFGSVFAQGSVQVSPRIRVFGGYSEGISTADQDLQNTLLDASSDATGVAASVLQAAPLLSGSSEFGGQQNLNHLHRLDLTATWLGNIDTVTFSVQRETTSEVGRQLNVSVPVTTNGTFGSVTEIHLLNDTLSLSGYFQYGINQSGLVANTSGDTVSFSVGLNKSFARELSAYVRVDGNYNVAGSAIAASGTRGVNGDQSSVTIGGVKRF